MTIIKIGMINKPVTVGLGAASLDLVFIVNTDKTVMLCINQTFESRSLDNKRTNYDVFQVLIRW